MFRITFSFIIVMIVLLISCDGVKKITTTEKTYEGVDQKVDEKYDIQTYLPTIVPMGNTQQTQTKGTTTITIEPSLFHLERRDTTESNAFYADPSKPDYDIWEVSHFPYYTAAANLKNSKSPFTIRIINKNQMPIRCEYIGFAVRSGQTSIDMGEDFYKRWKDAMVLTDVPYNFDKLEAINFNNIVDGEVFYFFLNGVPTAFNKDGTISERKNFEWYFKVNMKSEIKHEKKTYSYEAVKINESKCIKCNGIGHLPTESTCTSCSGTGQIKLLGLTSKCSKCNGTGKLYPKCDYCKGVGIFKHPQSKERQVKNSVTFNGWFVNIKTKPSGANVKIIDPKTGEYVVQPNTSPLKIPWLCASGNTCPIIIESMGKSIKVLPFDEKGKESGSIEIDFTKDKPVVKGAQIVN